MSIDVLRIAAFSEGQTGGNPAGVLIAEQLPDPAEMQRIAADVGYSETVFAAPCEQGWRVRYFSPLMEVPFCGHATIALGAALALRQGNGVFTLVLNQATITVEGAQAEGRLSAVLQSPPTHSAPASAPLVAEVLALFGYTPGDVSSAIAPARIHGGADHFALTLNTREALAAMHYDIAAGQALMLREGWATIMLAYAQTPQRFHCRNPFASGGVYEDPATGAAAAAYAGYLRDIAWPHAGAIDIIQGEDMGMPSRIHADITSVTGASIRVSGTARRMTAE
ncbi:PhzF family phenazine biosynthesis protein [Gibbsiella quercinecans]|uniref:PhzF family phenazine biosynthesis protein n=1 Tax=Gibbsiella quercinecans TaxID=929813 RepID=A0A250AWT8_9GAMM|nr:PhzF family phenazine biosynthesis protein [Gibbsiella quercinecans]ATA18374.1 PhzF family phenazine biosynthesis protein [Gibbsiella quercinecans]RLM13095.1 PhzF family phenazine biosynthesis protein [Gibbsiella quercinecans]RLM14418.1 PhzF family phenazine biosynthesis protein [Gibbsiella quercinecans]TCT90970.1 PhzF family phenazine biosynthesis protein [Gibbsiella quercinecans]